MSRLLRQSPPFASFSQLWGCFNSLGFRRGRFLLLKGYVDESYNERVFTLSAVMATGFDWAYFSQAWNKCLRSKNQQLRAAGRPRITRFHASDFSCRRGEFEGWSVDEQRAFHAELIRLYRIPKHMLITAYSIPLKDFSEEFPEIPQRRILPTCYGALLKFLMYETAIQFDEEKKRRPVGVVKISLIHDRSSVDGLLLEQFNKAVLDEAFPGRSYYSSIMSLGWEDGGPPLQAADLIAYENMKSADRYVTGSDRQPRKSLEALLNIRTLAGQTKIFGKGAMQELKAIIARQQLRD